MRLAQTPRPTAPENKTYSWFKHYFIEGFKNWVWRVYQCIISAQVHWWSWLSMNASELKIVFTNGQMWKFYTDKHKRRVLKRHYTMIKPNGHVERILRKSSKRCLWLMPGDLWCSALRFYLFFGKKSASNHIRESFPIKMASYVL